MPSNQPTYLSNAWRTGIFTDRVLFCTGGSGSICSAQTRAMVYLGANACIVGRNPEKTERMAKDIATARPGSKVLGIGTIDVRDVASLQGAIDRCVKELGGIDFLIAGAAGNFLSPMSKLSTNAFKSVIDIDLLGSYNVAKLAMPHIIQSIKQHPQDSATGSVPSGRIIFISATMHYTGYPLQTHASVAKAGVDALSANIAIEYGPLGVTSNVIAPGPIAGTEGMSRLAGGEGEAKRLTARIPLGRYGDVKDIADATVYLFSDAANYVNGEVLVVDGGAWRTSGTGPGSGDPDQEYPTLFVKGPGASKL